MNRLEWSVICQRLIEYLRGNRCTIATPADIFKSMLKTDKKKKKKTLTFLMKNTSNFYREFVDRDKSFNIFNSFIACKWVKRGESQLNLVKNY